MRFFYGQANDESWIHIIGGHFLVNHKLIRATEKGQAVHIMAEGETDPDIMTVVSPPLL